MPEVEVVLIDLDNTAGDFERGFLEKWRAAHPNEPFVPLEERNGFYIEDDYPKHLNEKIQEILRAPGFFRDLPPIEGAVEAIQAMAQCERYSVFICTSPLLESKSCITEKYEWVERHLGKKFLKRIIVANDKTLVRGTFLIDDKADITGIGAPEWEHLLFERPQNRHATGKRRVNWQNWKEVLESR